MVASLMKRMKELEDKNRRLKKMYAEERLVSESASRSLSESGKAILQAQVLVAERGLSIPLTCRTRSLSETGYRYQAKLSDKNAKIAGWLIRLTQWLLVVWLVRSVIRCDNGPESISESLAEWARNHGIEIAFIQPGNPQQNAYVERYNRTVRYDWLAHHLFAAS